MPARSVVFNTIRKHDGTQFRVLEPGEYTQMAGRAGRRGLDKVGTVIMCCFGSIPPPQPILKNMLTGTSTLLKSQFRLTYNMILNLLRVEDMSVENMIKRSFSEFATQRALTANEYPKLLAKGMKTLSKLNARFEQERSLLSNNNLDDLEYYYNRCSELQALNHKLHTHILSSAGGGGGGALTTGRILLTIFTTSTLDKLNDRGLFLGNIVRAPAMILIPPLMVLTASSSIDGDGGAGTKSLSDVKEGGDSASSSAVCLVLLPESYVPASANEQKQSQSTKKETRIGHLNYVGISKNRYYSILKCSLKNVLAVSDWKHKGDHKSVRSIYHGDGDKPNETQGSKKNILSSSFLMTKPLQKGRIENDFAGFTASQGRKKGDGELSFFGKKAILKEDVNTSNYPQLIDEIMIKLIDAEHQESEITNTSTNCGLPVLDLKACTQGVQKGDGTLEFRSACDRMSHILSDIRQCTSHYHPNLVTHYANVDRKETLKHRVAKLQHMLSNESLALFPDFLQRKSLLRTLGYVDENDTVCVKGRVACEVNTCESLIVTEMVFEGILNQLEPAEIVAALSALIFQERSKDSGGEECSDLDSELPERLSSCCKQMRQIAIQLGRMQQEHGLSIDPNEYCAESLKMGLVHVVYEWALGVPFQRICELTLVQEGSIVRTITRLDELCREVRNCARVVGNPTLYRRMEAASVAIKRDIVFASSLYVS